ncbi:MAG: hypothetical protein UY32_C0029G0003 [Candidatus Jorgensenbacteria bacterium GW2011_GWC1_48_8]|nr:MAG: hypothetical protein UY32_C0029G0003 [Candidatus Jorgensenbacteria bacterium GW2011_GWC1_48_8]
MRLYNVVKDLYFRKQLAVSERRLSELSEEGLAGPYDLSDEDEKNLASAIGNMELVKPRNSANVKRHDDDVD